MSWRAFRFYLFHPIIFLRRIGYWFHEIRHPDDPWLAQKAVKYLDQILKKDMTLFEWGSGRSTLWFSPRVKNVVSIEYNQDWSKRVESMIQEKQADNIDLRYIALEHPYKAPTQKHYDKVPDYVAEIFKFPKGHFDVIVIDGHYRLTCADQCLDYLNDNGYLVIDNSNRSSLEEWNLPSHWPLVHESENVVTRTSIWQKVVD